MPQIRGYALLFVITVVGIFGVAADKKTAKRTRPQQIPFKEQWCMPKTGLGIINHDRYIRLRSERNELMLGPERQSWTGKSAESPELVIIFDNSVFHQNDIPDNFDLSAATVISFEKSKVRFFDFGHMEGCYYERRPS